MRVVHSPKSQHVYKFCHLPKSHCTTQGDHIAIKGCSVRDVVKILCAFGVEIREVETIFKRKQKKMLSVDGSESNMTVVRGMHTVLGILCAVSFTSPISLFVIAFCHRFLSSLFVIAPQQIEFTSCVSVGISEERIRHSMALWETYRAILWELKLHGARGWRNLKELSIQNSKPKV
jgi:hypothetical protein